MFLEWSQEYGFVESLYMAWMSWYIIVESFILIEKHLLLAMIPLAMLNFFVMEVILTVTNEVTVTYFVCH